MVTIDDKESEVLAPFIGLLWLMFLIDIEPSNKTGALQAVCLPSDIDRFLFVAALNECDLRRRRFLAVISPCDVTGSGAERRRLNKTRLSSELEF